MLTLTLTPAQLQVITAGLGELPFKTAAPLFQLIQQQLKAAEAVKPEAVKPEAEATVDTPVPVKAK